MEKTNICARLDAVEEEKQSARKEIYHDLLNQQQQKRQQLPYFGMDYAEYLRLPVVDTVEWITAADLLGDEIYDIDLSDDELELQHDNDLVYSFGGDHSVEDLIAGAGAGAGAEAGAGAGAGSCGTSAGYP